MCLGDLFRWLWLLCILCFVLSLIAVHNRALGLSVFLAHFGDVAHRLGIRRHVFVLCHGLLTGIVGRNGQPIVLKRVLQELQIADAGFDILLRIEAVCYAKPLGGARHQLHQALRTLRGNGERIVVALHLNHRVYQQRIHVEILRCLGDQAMNVRTRVRTGPGADILGAATKLRTSFPVCASTFTTQTARAIGAVCAEAGRLAAARFPRNAVPRISSKQNRILLFYPIITGFLPSASFSFRRAIPDANAIILSCNPPGLCWPVGQASAWASTRRCCPIAEQPWWSTSRK